MADTEGGIEITRTIKDHLKVSPSLLVSLHRA